MAEPRTVTISLPPELAAQVDAAAEAAGRTRSDFFREAARQYLRRTQRWEQIFGYGERAARQAGVGTDEEVADAVSELRRSRRGR